MLRILQSGNQLPNSWPVSINDEFVGGNIGQLTTFGNNIVCGLSDGSAPIGVIDDINTKAFYAPVIDEIVIAGPIAGVKNGSGQLVTPNDVKVELANAYIQPNSFITNPIDAELIPTNGVLIFLAGTVLNFDADGDQIPDSIRTVVSYSYQVPNVMGDSTVLGSHRVTIWFGRMIFETDQYQTSVSYPINCSLFCSPDGKFTSKQYNPNYPGIGLCLAPPSAVLSSLQIMWI